MAGKRKSPRLRFNGRYFVANIYGSDGKRTMISFGPKGDCSEGEIYAAFGKWLDLYNQAPQKVLSYKSPYEAIKELVNPSTILKVGQLINEYLSWTRKTYKNNGRNSSNDIIERTERIKRFLEKLDRLAQQK